MHCGCEFRTHIPRGQPKLDDDYRLIGRANVVVPREPKLIPWIWEGVVAEGAGGILTSMLSDTHHTNECSSSRVIWPLLSMRGTLCCPPSLPLERSHSAKPPRGTGHTSGVRMVRSPCRWAA